MPEFCRHNRFIERCPICSKDLPELPGVSRLARSASDARGAGASTKAPRRERGSARGGRRDSLRVYADGSQRAVEDGYSCELVPGLRASEDARRLASELGFASARLWELATSPEGPYREAHDLGRAGELERASWLCFLLAYLSPTEEDEPFFGVAQAFAQTGGLVAQGDGVGERAGGDGVAEQASGLLAQADEPQGWADEQGGAIELDLEMLPLGPRTSHRQGAGTATLEAYRTWTQRYGSAQSAFLGDPSWSHQRRFERVFERLALPGLSRAARFELLVLLGRLDLYQLSADSLHLAAAGTSGVPGGTAASEPVLASAKRIFGIGDAINIERRAAAFAQACGTPIEALELALFNWGAKERATLGMPEEINDEQVEEAALKALGL